KQIRGKKPSKRQKLVTVRGQIDQSKNAGKFKINVKEIETTLNQQVELPRAPFPKNWNKASTAAKVKWMKQFEASASGRQFVARNKQTLEDAPAFNLRFSPKGEFVVYDVPPGVYGLQGRVDKEIDGVLHAFEVFAKITIARDVDEVTLDPLPVLVTPLLASGKPAPPISIVTFDGKKKLTLNAKQLKGKYVFVNFWSTEDYQNIKTGVDHQKNVQKMVGDLKDKYDLALLNVCMDENRRTAVKHIMKNQYELGLHGFTNGREHETVDRYGVRSTPTGYLIDPERNIAMSQYEFYNLTKMKDSLTEVIEDRITGKDKPTPAAEKEDNEEKEE
ncbi:hypothetical protein OAG71_03220, partial [bacterium]|nr:hypothetical protein [bacterium]